MSAAIHARVLERRAAIARAKVEAESRARFIEDAKGAKGDRGDPGPMPSHEWKGTKLRFQKPDGTWGKWVDLRGKAGKDGQDGAVIIRGGSSSTTTPTTPTEENMPYAKRTDFISDTLFYRGEAAPGSATSAAVWRIARVTIGGDNDVTEQWAGGTAEFDKVWDDRAVLSYV